MGNKALSHDSIFMLETESERPASERCTSTESQQGRFQQISLASRSLPRTGSSDMHGAVSGAVFGMGPQYIPRSGIWIGGSEITESFSELSSGPDHSQSSAAFAMSASPGSTQMPIGFSTPATTQGCLDSSAARHKMALNPRKQKKKKNRQAPVKPKQDEPSFPLISEENRVTKAEETDQKKLKRYSTGLLSQVQSKKTEVDDKKTTYQAQNTDVFASLGYPVSAAYGRRRRRKGSGASGVSECGSKGRSLKQFSQGLGQSSRAGSLPKDISARDFHYWHLTLEKQVMEQPTTPQAETTTPQEFLSDMNVLGKRNVGIDFEASKASTPQPILEDMEESMIGSPLSYHEDWASGAKKREVKAFLLPRVESPSMTEEEAILSVATEDQAFMDPSHIQSEQEEASSLGWQNDQFKMESSQDIPTISKKKPPEKVLQSFTASVLDMTSAMVEGGISAQRLSTRSLPQFLGESEAEEKFSDSKSTSEEGSGSEELAPSHSSQSLEKLEDEIEIYSESRSSIVELSSSEEQLTPECPSQYLKEYEDEEGSAESNNYVEKYSSTEDWSSSEEEPLFRQPAQALGKPKDYKEVSSVSESASEKLSVSVEQLTPRHSAQPIVRPTVQQQVSSSLVSTSAEWSESVELMPPTHPFQPRVSPKFTQVSAGPESTAAERVISVESLPPRKPSKCQMRPKDEQQSSSESEITNTERVVSMAALSPKHHFQSLMRPVVELSAGTESTDTEGNISVQPRPPRRPLQSQANPKVEQETSSFPESMAVEEISSMEPPPLKPHSQPFMNPEVQPNMFSGSEGIAAERVISVEPLLPKYSPQSLMNPQVQQISKSTADEDIFVEQQQSSGVPSQPLVRPKLRSQTFTIDSESTSTTCSASVEPTPSRHIFQSWVNPEFEQQVSAGPESTATERDISVELTPSRMSSQALMTPEVKQPISAGPENVAMKKDISTEQQSARHLPQSVVRCKVQQISTSFESAAVERGIFGNPLHPKYPAKSSVSSNIEKISTILQNTAVEGISKKLELPRQPSRSYVKFMAQQIFSESSATERGTYADIPPLSHPSKPFLKPKVEHHVFSDEKSADPEGGTLKILPTKRPFQSLKKLEESQEVSLYLENDPMKWSSSKAQMPPRRLSQASGKPEYWQEVTSVSDSSPQGWKSSEEQLSLRRPSQALEGSEFQPQKFSMCSANTPVERSGPEEHLSPSHHFQASGDPEYQPQVNSGSTSAAAEGTISESNPGSWSLPNKTNKHSQGSKDLTKSTLLPATKPGKFTNPPAWQASTSGGTLSKKIVSESGDGDNSSQNLPTNEADIENLFGVRLRKIPSSLKYKSENEDNSTQIPSLPVGPVTSAEGKERRSRSPSKALLDTAEKLTEMSDSGEKQESRPKCEGTAKKQPVYKIPGKPLGRQSGYAVSEPAWITMVKQRQRSCHTHVFMKESKAKSGPITKDEPRYGEADPENENQSKKISTSDVSKQEQVAQVKLPKSTKSVGFKEQKACQASGMARETRRSSSVPAVLKHPTEPTEPVWFSLAKKKAKAWRANNK
ncbi:acrosomal protein KIAA1210 homolog [Tupaia chinensis]|uniref:acrosomal protein KIAA1210 homolog n=1 Tax=Tupaia chinensis TaxID=246437 RepID=UPI000FFB3B41|nr:acrosomal protein KIAA1210 homolog [Tupaia chinensis]